MLLVTLMAILIVLGLWCSIFLLYCFLNTNKFSILNFVNPVVFALTVKQEKFAMLLADPLEQFDIVVILGLLGNTLAITNIGLVIVFNFFLIFCILCSVNAVCQASVFHKVVHNLLGVVITVLKDSVRVKKYSFILLFFIVFLFIFVSNLIGMVPYSITITSHFILTLFFSLAFFIGNAIIGVCYHKLNFFVLFLPEGVPVMIVPFLILIEYVSFLSKIFSLAIRLFANMMSGHILLKILIGFGWAILSSFTIYSVLAILPIGIVFCVIGLEFAIALLQAYVFVVLLSIYLNDIVNTH